MSNEADIVVIVDDVNDNAPSFDVASRLFGIPSSAAAYTVVTTLKVSVCVVGRGGQGAVLTGVVGAPVLMT